VDVSELRSKPPLDPDPPAGRDGEGDEPPPGREGVVLRAGLAGPEVPGRAAGRAPGAGRDVVAAGLDDAADDLVPLLLVVVAGRVPAGRALLPARDATPLDDGRVVVVAAASKSSSNSWNAM
jgi:hypothetical protein